MDIISKILSFFAINAGYANSEKTYIWFYYEPEIPKELR